MQKKTTIAAPDNPTVKNQNDPTIGSVPNQATKALPETNDCLRNREIHERVTTCPGNCFGSGFEYWFSRDSEWQPGNDDLF